MSHRRVAVVALLMALLVSPSALAAPEDPVAPEALSAGEAPVRFEPTPAVVEEGRTALPAPQPGAEVYPRPADGSYDITGRGFGHGIGMSQYAADGAGKAGLTHPQILAYSYPGTRLDTRTFNPLRVGITTDDDGTTRVAHRSGLRVSAGPGGTTYTLPTGRDQWRVRATGSSASTCTLEGRRGGVWAAAWPAGMPRSCPVTFRSSEDSVDLFLPDGSLRVYRGMLTATHIGSSALATVNLVPMQSYLRSVVNAEMPSSFHTQALRSQAVAARTYSARGVNGTSYYDTCDTVACQVYQGRGVRTSGGGISSFESAPADSAVSVTNGQVLTYPFPSGRALATTMFSSSNGGWSAVGSPAHPYLDGHQDPYDGVAGNRRHSWTGQLPVARLQSVFGIHRVERIQVLSRDGAGQWGGRIKEVRIEGLTAGGSYTRVDTTGEALRFARPWPTYADGLSSHYLSLGPPATGAVTRVAGADRWGTSRAVAASWPVGRSVAYVASGRNFPDALSAAARSGVHDAPVLLVDSASVPSDTRAALTRLEPDRIVVVGGTSAVSNGVLTTLRSYAVSGTVERVAGGDRYGTAARMASFYSPGVDRVYLASGEDYPDALAGAALAAHENAPLLLTASTGLSDATRAQLARLDHDEIVVLGGGRRIPTDVAQDAARYSGPGSLTRVAGDDRYETAELLARRVPASRPTAYLASGGAYPDALVAAALAGRTGSPLLLATPGALPPSTRRALDRIALTKVVAVGGSGVLDDTVLAQAAAYVP